MQVTSPKRGGAGCRRVEGVIEAQQPVAADGLLGGPPLNMNVRGHFSKGSFGCQPARLPLFSAARSTEGFARPVARCLGLATCRSPRGPPARAPSPPRRRACSSSRRVAPALAERVPLNWHWSWHQRSRDGGFGREWVSDPPTKRPTPIARDHHLLPEEQGSCVQARSRQRWRCCEASR